MINSTQSQITRVAAYLLRHYPVLWEQSQRMADDAINGGRSNENPEVNRKSEGIHSDPTAKKAIKLHKAHALAAKLAPIKTWIDERLPPENRKLLIAIWRVGNYGWRRIARESGYREVTECRRSWSALVGDLVNFL